MKQETRSQGSVTRWIGDLKAGEEDAAQHLWERYFDRLMQVCRRRLPGNARRIGDEEDVVLSVMDKFFRGAQEGRYPQLRDRHNLWKLLVVMAAQRSIDFVRRQQAHRRGSGRVVSESALNREGPKSRAIEQVVGQEPSPEFAASVAEECSRRISQLMDPKLRLVAQRKLEGCSNKEIAGELKCSVRSIERKLWVIRKKWEQEEPPERD